MAPARGHGGFRGGVRGRGRGRGRGAMRGGSRAGLRNVFEAGRKEEPMTDGDEYRRSPASEPVSNEIDESSAEEDEAEEEEAQPVSKAYQNLLQTFTSRHKPTAANGQPRRKRRKLDHNMAANDEDTVEVQGNAESDPTDDEEDEAVTSKVEEGSDSEIEEVGAEGRSAFQSHFEHPENTRVTANQWISKKLDVGKGGRCLLQVPDEPDASFSRRKINGVSAIQLKPKLVDNATRILGDFDHVEQAIAPSLFEYQDVMFGARTVKNAERMRHLVCLHALNHIIRTRDRVLKNNAKIAAAPEDDDTEYRDQGFTRPKVLFLLETKQACVRAIDSITRLYDFEQQENKKRFLENFSLPEDKFSDDKPEDFRELFEGNDENEFRIGVKMTRKTLKFYSTFYYSDIIFASPLGLRRAIEAGDKKKQDSDFLSSIEIVIMEQADATLMQNWEHAEFVYEHLNLQPKDAHGCDFSRVRSWYLDGHARYHRQTIVLSAYLTPKINTLYNKHMLNFSGRLKYTPDYTSGLIENLSHGIKQTFARFDSPSHLTDPDSRFKFFSSTILPWITRLPKPPEGGVGVLLFIPSYLDFVRVRNSLVDSDLSFASISEYTDATDVRKARSHFMNGRHALLLYTGRAHHFHRYHIRGVKRVVFYAVPENPVFYEEVIGFAARSVERGELARAEAAVRVCFSRWEGMELERVVGGKRVGKMMSDRGDVFDFV